MLNFITRTAARSSTVHNLHFLRVQIHPFSSSLLKPIQDSPNQHSFTISYLINSCGFSPEKAISASEHVKFETPDKPDSVLAFFKNHGFTQTQILHTIEKSPELLIYDPHKTLLPKLEFFESKGLSSTDVARIVSWSPYILKRSLKNLIIPSFNIFSSLVQSEEKTIVAFKRSARILLFDQQTHLAPNIRILRQAGVPNAHIMYLLMMQPRALMVRSDRFRRVVEEVEQMGIDPSRNKFVLAIHALRSMTKSTWEKKVKVYKKWGWTDDQILVAFKKNPWCMVTSEEKITAIMRFLVNELGWEPSFVASRPGIMLFSLEKRLVPRCAVYLALLSKGLIKTSLMTILRFNDTEFLTKVVNYHKEEAPVLLKLYKEKLDLAK